MKWIKGCPKKDGRYVAVLPVPVGAGKMTRARLGEYGTFRIKENGTFQVVGFKPDGQACVYPVEEIVAYFGPVPEYKEVK